MPSSSPALVLRVPTLVRTARSDLRGGAGGELVAVFPCAVSLRTAWRPGRQVLAAGYEGYDRSEPRASASELAGPMGWTGRTCASWRRRGRQRGELCGGMADSRAKRRRRGCLRKVDSSDPSFAQDDDDNFCRRATALERVAAQARFELVLAKEPAARSNPATSQSGRFGPGTGGDGTGIAEDH